MWLQLQKHAVCVLYLSEGAAAAAATTNNRHDHRHHHHRHCIAWRIKAATTAATRAGQTQRRLLSVTKTLPAALFPHPTLQRCIVPSVVGHRGPFKMCANSCACAQLICKVLCHCVCVFVCVAASDCLAKLVGIRGSGLAWPGLDWLVSRPLGWQFSHCNWHSASPSAFVGTLE